MPTYKGPYSSDDGFENFTKGMSRDASYPTRKPNVYGLGPPSGSRHDFSAIDCSGTIDPQVKYGFSFDDQRNSKSGTSDWSNTKSDEGLAGFSGDVLPSGRASNHPARGSLNTRGKAGPQVGGKNR